VTRGQPAESEETFNPTEDAKTAVDGFLCAYRSGLTDSLLLEEMGQVWEFSSTLREAGDRRLDKPLTDVIADTGAHSDDVSAFAIGLLGALRAKSAVPAVRRYLKVLSKPKTRLLAAASLAILGDAEKGVPVLEEYIRQPKPLSEGYVYTVIMRLFFDNFHAVRLQGSVQDSIVTSYFQGMARSGQNLGLAVCYLLQKGEKSRDIAFSAAEDALQKSAVSKGAIAVPLNLRAYVRMFGGARGQALLDKYQ
jgi:hypothetical protein